MLIRQFAPFFLLLLLGKWADGQSWVRSNAIPVTDNGDTLAFAWAGGMQSPQFSALDLDNDGRLDLIAFDRQDNRVLPFRRVASGHNGFEYVPDYISSFPSTIQHWCLAKDFDGDGLIDLIASTPQGSNVQVFKNISATGQPVQFSPYLPKLFSDYPPFLALYVSSSDLPAIHDVDQDGDLDILTFNLGGSMVEWHQNQSKERFGHADSLIFEVQSRCFGHFQESAAGCVAAIGLAPCGPGERNHSDKDLPSFEPSVHVGSTLLALDLNNDTLTDLVVGDVGCREVYALYNGGTAQIAHFDSIETGFPILSGSIDIRTFPAVFSVDLDEDGRNDLISAPNSPSGSDDISGIQWHRNISSNPEPEFQNQGHGIFQSEMVELGTGAYPTFVDIDQDGKMDLLIGSLGKNDTAGNLVPRLFYLRNTGTNNAPSFNVEDNDYLGFQSSPSMPKTPGISPTTGDLDLDGDQDLILGNQDGTLFYFQNNASSGSAAQFVLQNANWQGIDVGLNSAPHLYDWDADDKLDLLIGNAKGRIAYYKNIGTQQSPSMVLVTDTLGQIKINDESGFTFTNGFARPLMVDIDHDGNDELLVGTITGEVQVFESHGLQPFDAFPKLQDFAGIDFGSFSAPASAILDNYGPTILVGTLRGGVELVQNTETLAAEDQNVLPTTEIVAIPNPFANRLEVRVTGRLTPDTRAWITDLQGRTIWQSQTLSSRISIETDQWSPGLYHLIVLQKGNLTSKRVLKLP